MRRHNTGSSHSSEYGMRNESRMSEKAASAQNTLWKAFRNFENHCWRPKMTRRPSSLGAKIKKSFAQYHRYWSYKLYHSVLWGKSKHSLGFSVNHILWLWYKIKQKVMTEFLMYYISMLKALIYQHSRNIRYITKKHKTFCQRKPKSVFIVTRWWKLLQSDTSKALDW